MSSHQTVNSEPNSSLTDTDIATRHPTATAFTVLNKPVGKYFLTTNDDFFPCTDVSHLLPHSNVIQRVIRANDDDYPEIWLTLDPVSNSMRMGTSISYRPRPTDTGKEMKGVSSTVHMIARDPFDQQTQTRTRDSWNDDTMSRGALGADTPLTGDKSVRSQIIALIPSIQDDEKGLIEIEDGVRRRVGMVQDYVVRPRLTSGNYHLVQDGTTQSTSVGNINNANDDFVTSYTEDPAGTLDIAYNWPDHAHRDIHRNRIRLVGKKRKTGKGSPSQGQAANPLNLIHPAKNDQAHGVVEVQPKSASPSPSASECLRDVNYKRVDYLWIGMYEDSIFGRAGLDHRACMQYLLRRHTRFDKIKTKTRPHPEGEGEGDDDMMNTPPSSELSSEHLKASRIFAPSRSRSPVASPKHTPTTLFSPSQPEKSLTTTPALRDIIPQIIETQTDTDVPRPQPPRPSLSEQTVFVHGIDEDARWIK
ncbi:hypothetical protein I302_102663 [Kwoniella bestiolae CBS 10118]|uniref:Uncharacterized protein n=1 Tax=Kwoniella bestiolae CBS 10118 TaxID=1296100 RepID=A0A1B9GFL5_9TREE|nr:hypothetical protein I302_01357 [Kwoniella bestiolae CBS 10118]OCF29844.1 hypothetical protein I302_01357 [Kwoniella bestiolae CBS 10118]